MHSLSGEVLSAVFIVEPEHLKIAVTENLGHRGSFRLDQVTISGRVPRRLNQKLCADAPEKSGGVCGCFVGAEGSDYPAGKEGNGARFGEDQQVGGRCLCSQEGEEFLGRGVVHIGRCN
jgi:hypothetical protein